MKNQKYVVAGMVATNNNGIIETHLERSYYMGENIADVIGQFNSFHRNAGAVNSEVTAVYQQVWKKM